MSCFPVEPDFHIAFVHRGLDPWLSSRQANVSTAHVVPIRDIYCFSWTYDWLARMNSIRFVASQRHGIGISWQLFVRNRDFLSFNGDRVCRNQGGQSRVQSVFSWIQRIQHCNKPCFREMESEGADQPPCFCCGVVCCSCSAQ